MATIKGRVGFVTLAALGNVMLAVAGCGSGIPESLLVTVDGLLGSPDMVTVQFRNLTSTTAVDVEFHASTAPVVNAPDDLLVESTRVKANIGVAGTGIIQPLDSDEIQFPCTETLLLGTSGGAFLDNDSGEMTGSGTVRWISEKQVGLCGTIVTFDFAGSEGAFTTTIRVGG